jgi:hypothetical protein
MRPTSESVVALRIVTEDNSMILRIFLAHLYGTFVPIEGARKAMDGENNDCHSASLALARYAPIVMVLTVI